MKTPVFFDTLNLCEGSYCIDSTLFANDTSCLLLPLSDSAQFADMMNVAPPNCKLHNKAGSNSKTRSQLPLARYVNGGIIHMHTVLANGMVRATFVFCVRGARTSTH